MIVLCSNDAGGAQILSSWAAKQKLLFYCIANGPAKKIFLNKIKKIKFINDFKKLKHENIKHYICSTSWNSSIEMKNLYYAKKKNINTIVYFDHWSNYEKRLVYKNRDLLPNEIWVNDIYAYNLVKKYYPKVKIKKKENYFLNEIKKKIKIFSKKYKKKKNIKKNILYITEPVEEQAKKIYKNKNHWGFNEFDLFDLFTKKIDKISKIRKILVRIHPSEKKEKYKKLKKKLRFSFSKNSEIIKDIIWSDIVVGLDSMAMVIALIGGKKVYTTLPFKKGKITLPYTKIKKLINL